jgi:hypothetical protein
MMCIGVTPHNQIEVLLFTVTHEVLKSLRWRGILGIMREICRAYDQASLYPFLVIVDKDCYQVPAGESWSHPGCLDRCKNQARGLTAPFTENREYPGKFKPLMQPL